MTDVKLKIAVIGAGPSGLCAAKHSLDRNYDVTVFEQTSKVGGLWNYSNRTGDDDNGLPIHSTIYESLITNLPVESMGFPEYPFRKKNRSFVRHEEVLQFFEAYANEFNLIPSIKFEHQVVQVKPLQQNRWQIMVRNLRSSETLIESFDAVFVCTGHYHEPFTPDYIGLNDFDGQKIHSRDYRTPDRFENEEVLVIGGGPSGKDLTLDLASKAKRILFSHHRTINIEFPSNVAQVGDVKQFTKDTVVFEDGTVENITAILFCTGYQFSFSFLSVDSGIYLENPFHVQPLYKHLLNINHPTMALVGLQICAYTYMYDLQIRLSLKYWSNEIPLPSKSEMITDMAHDMKKQQEKSPKPRNTHFLGIDQRSYFSELCDAGQLENVPEVLLNIYEDCNELRVQHPNNYREFNYNIIDNKTFTRAHMNAEN